jgi:hypothetical protein
MASSNIGFLISSLPFAPTAATRLCGPRHADRAPAGQLPRPLPHCSDPGHTTGSARTFGRQDARALGACHGAQVLRPRPRRDARRRGEGHGRPLLAPSDPAFYPNPFLHGPSPGCSRRDAGSPQSALFIDTFDACLHFLCHLSLSSRIRLTGRPELYDFH